MHTLSTASSQYLYILKELPNNLDLLTGRVLWRVFPHHPRESRVRVPGVKGLTGVPGACGSV